MTHEERTERLLLFAKMVYKACGLSCWCFGRSKKLYTSTSPAETEFLMFLELGNCLDYAIEHAQEPSRPILMSDPIGMLWACEGVWSEGELSYLILMGPVFNAVSSLQNLQRQLRQMDFSATLIAAVVEKLNAVPLLTIPNLNQYIKMLHWVIHDEVLEEGQIQLQLQEEWLFAAPAGNTGRNGTTGIRSVPE